MVSLIGILNEECTIFLLVHNLCFIIKFMLYSVTNGSHLNVALIKNVHTSRNLDWIHCSALRFCAHLEQWDCCLMLIFAVRNTTLLTKGEVM